MKSPLILSLLILSNSVFAASVNESCAPVIKERTEQVVGLFVDNPKTKITIESATYKEAPLEVIDGDIAQGKTYKVSEVVQIGEGSDVSRIKVESGVIAPSKHFAECQVLYTNPGSMQR